MTTQFENKNLVNFKGQVLVDNDGIVKIYSSLKVANRSAEKLGAKVVKNVSKYIIVL
jgi:hypothetical protein